MIVSVYSTVQSLQIPVYIINISTRVSTKSGFDSLASKIYKQNTNYTHTYMCIHIHTINR